MKYKKMGNWIKKTITRLGIGFLRNIPERPADILINCINHIRLRRINNRKIPVTLTIFVTSRCNALCSHCFYWKELTDGKGDISIYNLEKLANNLIGLKQILLTGGEPFLRDDLAEISKIFYRKGVRAVTIPTNGILTERIVHLCSDIIKSTNLDSFKVNVSLDGTRKKHDSIRNVPGGYDKALETVLRLKELKRLSKNFDVSISTVITKDNLSNMEAFLTEVSQLKVPLIFSIGRGTNYNLFRISRDKKRDFNPRNAEVIESISDLEMVREVIRANTNRSEFVNWNIFQRIKFDLSIDIIKKRRRLFDCQAGYLDGVIFNDGSVALCELTNPIGNLMDYDIDFTKLWWSDPANKMRESLKTCCCIHGCNITSSMQYDAPSLKRIIRDPDHSP